MSAERKLNSGPTEDQIRVAAMSKGCTEENSKVVADCVAKFPELDLQKVIKEVAGSKSASTAEEVADKVIKAQEKEDKTKKEEAPKVQSTAPTPGTPEYNNTKIK